jgi:penicillin-binding protein 2
MLGILARFTGKTAEQIAASYAYAQPDWYIPVGEVSAEELKGYYDVLSSYSGVRISEYTSRFYNQGGAPHTTGYVIGISAEELEKYKRLGYGGSERIGNSGLEESKESILAGKHGGTLYLAGPDGTILQPIAKVDSTPANSVYMTIDRGLQANAQDALKGFNGAIVVIERDTGRVLAMASSPEFDPNLFDPNNPNINYTTDIPQGAYINRAVQGEYPLGSVFKIITMAAGLESGVFTPDSTYNCQYDWTELSDMVRHDWTWQHCEDEKLASTDGTCTTKPSGELTLKQGLMRSCNPWFWHIGLALYQTGRTTAISDMARAFGLGAPTGIDIKEAAGNIVDPSEPVQAVNSAIGQDPVLVTPLQVARFIAAVGNGGTLYRPQLIEKITDANGQTVQSFKPEAQGTLPLKPENLKAIQDAMHDVVDNPRGTAYYRLGGVSYRIYGKTGTAETSTGTPHAWFAGYTDLNNPNIPDIAVVVILEYQGEGSQWAAPVFKRVVDSYIYGKPQSVYPWESSFGVWRTPAPTETATPTP